MVELAMRLFSMMKKLGSDFSFLLALRVQPVVQL